MSQRSSISDSSADLVRSEAWAGFAQIAWEDDFRRQVYALEKPAPSRHRRFARASFAAMLPIMFMVGAILLPG